MLTVINPLADASGFSFAVNAAQYRWVASAPFTAAANLFGEAETNAKRICSR